MTKQQAIRQIYKERLPFILRDYPLFPRTASEPFFDDKDDEKKELLAKADELIKQAQELRDEAEEI